MTDKEKLFANVILMKKYITIEIDDPLTHQVFMSIIRENLGKGINSVIISESLEQLKNTIIEDESL